MKGLILYPLSIISTLCKHDAQAVRARMESAGIGQEHSSGLRDQLGLNTITLGDDKHPEDRNFRHNSGIHYPVLQRGKRTNIHRPAHIK